MNIQTQIQFLSMPPTGIFLEARAPIIKEFPVKSSAPQMITRARPSENIRAPAKRCTAKDSELSAMKSVK